MKAGSRASWPLEPGQVRKEAALRGRRLRRGDTWPELAAGKALRSSMSTVGARPFPCLFGQGVSLLRGMLKNPWPTFLFIENTDPRLSLMLLVKSM